MKFYLGVTDLNWFHYLSQIQPEDVNFWQPGGTVRFKVLEKGAPFLFKLKSPLNAIGGVGFFTNHSFLPISFAWEAFNDRNGCPTFAEFKKMILNYRKDNHNPNPNIGCIVLTNPIFFRKEDWIELPSNWSSNIVQGKSYSTKDTIGSTLWKEVESRLYKYLDEPTIGQELSIHQLAEPEPRYGSILSKIRIGQGAFRVLITDAYSRRCSITGEKTLPVLEAAHIKPYSQSGPHDISNGILLRSDMHKLFDTGYLTITTKHHVEVSSRIKEEFKNGREYYKYHGSELLVLPDAMTERPSSDFLEWHNNNIYQG